MNNLYGYLTFYTGFSGRKIGESSLVRLSKPSDDEAYIEEILVYGSSSSIVKARNDDDWYIFSTPDGVVEPCFNIKTCQSIQYFHSVVDENINGRKLLCDIKGTFYADSDESALLLHELQK